MTSKSAIGCLLALAVFGLDADDVNKCEGTSLIQNAKRGDLLTFDDADKPGKDDDKDDVELFLANRKEIDESDVFEFVDSSDFDDKIEIDYQSGVVTSEGIFAIKYESIPALLQNDDGSTVIQGKLHYQMTFSQNLLQTNLRCPGFGFHYSLNLMQQQEQDIQNVDADGLCPCLDKDGKEITGVYKTLGTVLQAETRAQALFTKFKMGKGDTNGSQAKKKDCKKGCKNDLKGKAKAKERKQCERDCRKAWKKENKEGLLQQMSEISTSGPDVSFYFRQT